MEREKIIEIILGAIFIVLLIMMILLFIIASEIKADSKKQTPPTKISNFYNTYNNYALKEYTQLNQVHTLIKFPVRNYDYLKYTSKGYNQKYSAFFGNKINEYKVYVKNNEYKGGYFTVKFYLTDYYGRTRTELVTHYLKPHEIKKFSYKNIYSDGKESNSWDYKVVSNTKI